MLQRVWLVLLLLLVFTGCQPGSLNLTIRFDQIHGLVKGDRVMHEHNPIGTVTAVTYTNNGDYEAVVMIRENFKEAVTEYSRFYITDDPGRQGRKAVEMLQAGTGGAPLKDNAVVEGSSRTSAIIEQVMGGFETGFEEIQKRFERFAEDLKQVPESDAYKKLERQLKELTEEMQRSGNKTRETIEKQWLPRIERELENLKKRLREMGREKELKPLEVQFEKIKS